MSQAFVKEEDPDAPIVLPARSISGSKNYVTVNGYQQLIQKNKVLESELDSIKGLSDLSVKTRMAELRRDITYFSTRIRTAVLVEPIETSKVRFGCTVSFIDENNQKYQFQIVGEDEADPGSQKISWTSPLARSLIGRTCGDILTWYRQAGELEIEIQEVVPQQLEV